MNVYILFSWYDSPIAITHPEVKKVYLDKKQAIKEAKRLNASPRTHRRCYFVKTIKVQEVGNADT